VLEWKQRNKKHKLTTSTGSIVTQKKQWKWLSYKIQDNTVNYDYSILRLSVDLDFTDSNKIDIIIFQRLKWRTNATLETQIDVKCGSRQPFFDYFFVLKHIFILQ